MATRFQTALQVQKFESHFIDRGRLESLLKTTHPSPEEFKVSRKLDYWVVEARFPLEPVSASR